MLRNRLCVPHLENLVPHLARRDGNLHDIPCSGAHQPLTDGRLSADPILQWIRLHRIDDHQLPLFTLVEIANAYMRPEAGHITALDAVRDDLRHLQRPLDLSDASIQNGLVAPRGMVLEVLGEIAVGARLPKRFGDLRAPHGLELLELLLELAVASLCENDTIGHRRVLLLSAAPGHVRGRIPAPLQECQRA